MVTPSPPASPLSTGLNRLKRAVSKVLAKPVVPESPQLVRSRSPALELRNLPDSAAVNIAVIVAGDYKKTEEAKINSSIEVAREVLLQRRTLHCGIDHPVSLESLFIYIYSLDNSLKEKNATYELSIVYVGHAGTDKYGNGRIKLREEVVRACDFLGRLRALSKSCKAVHLYLACPHGQSWKYLVDNYRWLQSEAGGGSRGPPVHLHTTEVTDEDLLTPKVAARLFSLPQPPKTGSPSTQPGGSPVPHEPASPCTPFSPDSAPPRPGGFAAALAAGRGEQPRAGAVRMGQNTQA